MDALFVFHEAGGSLIANSSPAGRDVYMAVEPTSYLAYGDGAWLQTSGRLCRLPCISVGFSHQGMITFQFVFDTNSLPRYGGLDYTDPLCPTDYKPLLPCVMQNSIEPNNVWPS